MTTQEFSPTELQAMAVDQPQKALFAPLSQTEEIKEEFRRIPVPPHRMSPLKAKWLKIYTPLVEHLKLQVRMNTKRKAVEIKTTDQTINNSCIQKAADFVRAFTLGFDLDDCIAILRMDDLFVDSFEVKDVKRLHGDHLSRAIGRIAGKGGKTKFAIENTTKTRMVVADTKIHILGTFQNIKLARESVVSLILGSPPGKVYNHLKNVASRMKERF